jgi:hypothetical protein
MRRPTLAHTSALATPGVWIMRTAPGIAVNAKTVAAAAVLIRLQNLIAATS